MKIIILATYLLLAISFFACALFSALEKMNRRDIKTPPIKYRKAIIRIQQEFIEGLKTNSHSFINWEKHLHFLIIGKEDGWIKTNNTDYLATVWLWDRLKDKKDENEQ